MMITRVTLTLLAASLFLSASPFSIGSTQAAQPGTRDEAAAPMEIAGGLHRDVALPVGDSTTLLFVWGGSAVVAGTADAVIAVNGDLLLLPSARVGTAFVARGVADLHDGSIVTGDLHMLGATLEQAPGATVHGQVRERQWGRVARGLRTFGILIAIGISLAVFLGALIAVAVAPVAMRRADTTLRTETGVSLLFAALAWLLMPWIALQFAATIVGLPIGLGYWLFILPTLGFIGYLVSAVTLGNALLRKARGTADPERPYLAASLGAVILLAVGLVPVVGAIVSLVAVMIGTGAVIVAAGRPVERRASSRRGARRVAREPLAPVGD